MCVPAMLPIKASEERRERERGNSDESVTCISLDACDLMQVDNTTKGEREEARERESASH